MKVLKGRLHVEFGDLMPGETFVFNGEPCMKMCGSAGAKRDIVIKKLKADIGYLNAVHLSSGVTYHYPKDEKIEKVDLGITGMDVIED